jgi:hypothetical protein
MSHSDGLKKVLNALDTTATVRVKSRGSGGVNWTKWGAILTIVGALIAAAAAIAVPFIEDALDDPDPTAAAVIPSETPTLTPSTEPSETPTLTLGLPRFSGGKRVRKGTLN